MFDQVSGWPFEFFENLDAKNIMGVNAALLYHNMLQHPSLMHSGGPPFQNSSMLSAI